MELGLDPEPPPHPPRAVDPREGQGLSPLTVLGHLQSPAGGHWGATAPSIRDAQNLHGLPLWPPLPMSAQHGRIHTFPRGV